MEDNFSTEGGGGVDGSAGKAGNGERWGAVDEALLACPSLTSCCAARFLTGCGLIPVLGPGVGDPFSRQYRIIGITHLPMSKVEKVWPLSKRCQSKGSRLIHPSTSCVHLGWIYIPIFPRQFHFIYTISASFTHKHITGKVINYLVPPQFTYGYEAWRKVTFWFSLYLLPYKLVYVTRLTTNIPVCWGSWTMTLLQYYLPKTGAK